MDWKKFSTPTALKIIISIVLLVISVPLSSESKSCNPTIYGFPLKFFQFGGCVDLSPCIETTEPDPHITCKSAGFVSYEIYPDVTGIMAFVINLIFWYFISSASIWIYNKFKR